MVDAGKKVAREEKVFCWKKLLLDGLTEIQMQVITNDAKKWHRVTEWNKEVQWSQIHGMVLDMVTICAESTYGSKIIFTIKVADFVKTISWSLWLLHSL